MIPTSLFHLFDCHCQAEGLEYNLVRLDPEGFEIEAVLEFDLFDRIAAAIGIKSLGNGRYKTD